MTPTGSTTPSAARGSRVVRREIVTVVLLSAAALAPFVLGALNLEGSDYATPIAAAALLGSGALLLAPSLQRRRAPRRLLVLLAATALALSATMLALDRLPLPLGKDLLAQKLAQLRQQDSVDTLLIGSSRLHRQIDPRVLDEESLRHGSPRRSFNLGVPGTRALELSSVVRRVLRQRRGLRLLVVDAMDEPLNEEAVLHPRSIRWHDLGNLLPVVDGILSSPLSATWKLSELQRHGEAFLYHFSHLGAALAWLGDSGWEDPLVPVDNRGFLSLDEEMHLARTAAQRRELQRRFHRLHRPDSDYPRRLRRLRRSDSGGALTDRFELGLFEKLQALCDQRGVTIVFLIDARIRRQPNLVYAREIGAIENLLRFDDPDRYPELYAAENRFDIHHLDEEMTPHFSRLVAHALSELEHDP